MTVQNTQPRWTVPSGTNHGACKVVKVFGFKSKSKKQENLVLIKHWAKQLLSLGNQIRGLIVLPECLMAEVIDGAVLEEGKSIGLLLPFVKISDCWYLPAGAFTVELLVPALG